jgi:hypothetical protein
METRELFKFGSKPILATPDGVHVDLQAFWSAGGAPKDDRHWSKFLADPKTQRRADRIENESGSPSVIHDDTNFKVYVHRYLALEYAEDLSVDFWFVCRKYLAGEDTGYYSSPDAGVADSDGDPVLASLDGARKAYILARSAHQIGQSNQREIESSRREIEDLRNKIGDGPTHWTVSAWCARNGVRITKDIARREGGNLSRICRQRGFVVPDDTVCMGSDYPARRWPAEAINVWWPDFKRREGIA